MIISAYCGYVADEQKLRSSASGGMGTAMAENMIESGGIVYGVSYYPPNNFKDVAYIRVSNIKDVELLRSTKYIKATLTREIMDSAASDLDNGFEVLFIGLPCDVMALKNYIKKAGISDEKLICVDLICRGPTTPKVAEEYIGQLEKKYKSKIVDFNVRYKNPYWKPPYLYAKFENGRVFTQPFYETNYGIAFSMMPENKCYICKNKGDNHVSDVTVGDFWGSSESDIGYNKFGASVALVNTQKGDLFVNSLKNFELFPTNAENAVKSNRRYTQNVVITDEMKRFKNNFEEKGLRYAASKSLSMKNKIKRSVKRILMK